jgi:hypothetical protein
MIQSSLLIVEENKVQTRDTSFSYPTSYDNQALFSKTPIWTSFLLDTNEAPSTYCMNIRYLVL